MRLLSSWRCLKPVDRRLLLQSLALVAGVRVGLWLLPFSTVRRILDGMMPQRGGEAQPGVSVRPRGWVSLMRVKVAPWSEER